MNQRSRVTRCAGSIALAAAIGLAWAGILHAAPGGQDAAAAAAAKGILAASGIRGGLVVHLGCGDGRLTAALFVVPPSGGRKSPEGGRLPPEGGTTNFLVQGLDADPQNVESARRYVQSLGLYGKVSIDRLAGSRLPYVDNLVNLVVAEELGAAPMEEVMRVLAPGGVACVGSGGQWNTTVKPRPEAIDDWTHYLYDASNNAVSGDSLVGPPRRMQWVGSPPYSRHHDRMSSLSAAVSAGGRVFYIFDEALPASILTPPSWRLIARDAFNGTVLWKRPIGNWFTHLWPLKSGPAQLPRRLVAVDDCVYVTLDLEGPVLALDAATGETVRTYAATAAAEEIICSEGVLFVLVNDAAEKPDYDGRERFVKGYAAKFWDEAPRKITAVGADDGAVLWSVREAVLPTTLAADSKRVVFHNGQSIVALDRQSGGPLWKSRPVARAEEIRSFYAPTLVLYGDVVLFSGGETAGLQTGSWYESGEDTLTALSAATGEVLWTGYHPPSGYRSPEDLLVAGGLVWTGETTSGRVAGVFSGRDPRTGEVKSEFAPNVDTYWFHHRCYRGKATDQYLLMSRTGVEFIDIENERWITNHWVRGACLYGVMPANGLLYAPQHPCACYLESKLSGFSALAAEAGDLAQTENGTSRLERGPAYGGQGTGYREQGTGLSALNLQPSADWPTYRHDAARSGRASTSVPADLETAWQTKLGGRLTAPVIAAGKLFVASVDAHAVHALDAASGEPLWQFTAGGRIDSPPTYYQGRILFGSADGYVYCLRADDGALAWRFRAAPLDRRLTACEQIESVWPVPGSVLVQDGVAYCVAGRSMFLDGGLRLLRLEPATGRLLSETMLDGRDPAAGGGPEDYVSWLNMPPALPDVLSSDGRLVYMRSQPFALDGTRLPLEAMPVAPDPDRGAPPATQRAERAHLFSPTGFLDDTWWHRTYWVYGSTFVSGWCGYFLAGKYAPSGRILVFDDEKVYGFGRKPQYYRWTTPIEHHLFAADKTPLEPGEGDAAKPGAKFLVRHHWTADLPLLVRAMVLTEGVLLAAGPPDFVDEEEAMKQIDDPAVQAGLAEQAASLAGQRGGLLRAVSAADGQRLSEVPLEAPPVFDGMAAAAGRVYLATESGAVVCLAGR